MPSPHPESNPSDAAIAHLAHDLRNLLATARGHAELQGASAVASEYQELRQSLAAIGHASARAGAL
ncbi:MAG: hypothetical protein MK213_02665, partial [Planctomycetes bacterium]|nr:hypothetical protein [Planctomycetota bacterium]